MAMTKLSRRPIERKTVSARVNVLSFTDDKGALTGLATAHSVALEVCTDDLAEKAVDKLILSWLGRSSSLACIRTSSGIPANIPAVVIAALHRDDRSCLRGAAAPHRSNFPLYES